MKKFLIFAGIIILVAGAGFGAYFYTQKTTTDAKNKEIENVKKDYEKQVNNLKQENQKLEDSQKKSQTKTSAKSVSGNIILDVPQEGAVITSPITVSGQAKVFEGNVSIRIKDSAGNVVKSDFTTANMPDVKQLGPFSKSVTFTKPNTSAGTIEVYSKSAKDGTETDIVKITIKFVQ